MIIIQIIITIIVLIAIKQTNLKQNHPAMFQTGNERKIKIPKPSCTSSRVVLEKRFTLGFQRLLNMVFTRNAMFFPFRIVNNNIQPLFYIILIVLEAYRAYIIIFTNFGSQEHLKKRHTQKPQKRKNSSSFTIYLVVVKEQGKQGDSGVRSSAL